MKKCIGTEIVNMKPMTRQEYNDFRGWELPSDEVGTDLGYLVERPNSPNSNTNEYAGYVSWLPKAQADSAYKQSGNLSFGDALLLLKQGKAVARQGWNGKGMWLMLVQGSPNIKPVAGSAYTRQGIPEVVSILPHIDMYTVYSSGRRAMAVGWIASQSDMLSEYWVEVIL